MATLCKLPTDVLQCIGAAVADDRHACIATQTLCRTLRAVAQRALDDRFGVLSARNNVWITVRESDAIVNVFMNLPIVRRRVRLSDVRHRLGCGASVNGWVVDVTCPSTLALRSFSASSPDSEYDAQPPYLPNGSQISLILALERHRTPTVLHYRCSKCHGIERRGTSTLQQARKRHRHGGPPGGTYLRVHV
jgi:hypothetical protein